MLITILSWYLLILFTLSTLAGLLDKYKPTRFKMIDLMLSQIPAIVLYCLILFGGK